MAAAAVTFVGNGKVITMDAAATWIGFPGLALSTITFVEGTGSLREKVSATTAEGYGVTAANWTGEPWDFSSGGADFDEHIVVWMYIYEGWDTLANGGFRIRIADDLATDSVGTWYVGPQNGYVAGWYPFIVNPAASFDAVVAGTALWTLGGNPAQLTNVDGFGCGWKVLSTITGNVDNASVDAIVVGKGYQITNGDAGSTEGKFSDFITFEDNTTTGRFGFLRNVSGVPFVRGKLYIGAESGATNTEFIDSGFAIVWEAVTLSNGSSSAVSATHYELKFQKGSGTTDIVLADGILKAVAPQSVILNFAGSTSASLSGVNVDRGAAITLDTAVTWNDSTLTNCGQITPAGADFQNNSVLGYTGSADTAALVWNVNSNPSGKLDGMTFAKSATLHHAIEFSDAAGAAGTKTLDLTDITFTGFAVFNINGTADNDTALVFEDTGTNTVWTVNLSGTSSPSYKKRRSGDTVTFVNATTLTVTGLRNPTEIKVIDSATRDDTPPYGLPTILHHEENVTDGVFGPVGIDAGATPDVDIHIVALGYQNARLLDVDMSTDRSIPISQVLDRQYLI